MITKYCPSPQSSSTESPLLGRFDNLQSYDLILYLEKKEICNHFTEDKIGFSGRMIKFLFYSCRNLKKQKKLCIYFIEISKSKSLI